MDAGGPGWSDALTAWWFDFLDEKGGKGVSKDTWSMVRRARSLLRRSTCLTTPAVQGVRARDRRAVREVRRRRCVISDGGLERGGADGNAAAWPSTIDDFVEYAKERLAREG
jgi:DCN1-like protein 1/2